MEKLRVWDNKMVTSTLSSVIQMQAEIDKCLANVDNASIEDLPPSVVPTSLLYQILICYSVLYDLLEKQNLVSSGNIKQTNSYH